MASQELVARSSHAGPHAVGPHAVGSHAGAGGMLWLLLLLLAIATHGVRSQAIQDSRCYLMNGGAVESFFISEDTPVGSVIGTLSVNGDPDAQSGNISLRLQEKEAAVGIVAGSKDVTLLRRLDREEQSGPSNVYVNVRCDRRRTSDPSFIIPVSVRVWDVNDNAPQWEGAGGAAGAGGAGGAAGAGGAGGAGAGGAGYTVRVSELTAPGARVLAVRARDSDQPGPHAAIRYSVLPSAASEYLGFANELEGSLVVLKPLDYETLNNFTLTLRAEDQGSPPLHNDTTLRVIVLDADDQNPVFSHEHYTAVVPDDAVEGTVLATSPGTISAVDQDVGINAPLYYSSTGDKRSLLLVDRDSGQIAVSKELLKADLPATVVLKATQVDNSDRYALATLSLSAASPRRAQLSAGGVGDEGGVAGGVGGGGRGVQFSRRGYSVAVREDTAPPAVLTTLHTNRDTRNEPLQFYVSDRSFLDKFAINSAGEVILRKALDYEQEKEYRYQVMLTDGIYNDTTSLNITVLNVNEWEPRFRYPHYEFRLPEGGTGGAGGVGGAGEGEGLVLVGKLDVFDGDSTDTIKLMLRGTDAGAMYINESGELYVRSGALRSGATAALHAVVTARDSGDPPRQSSVAVAVHVGSSAGGSAGGSARSASMLGVFGAALAVLALLVLALLAYIYRVRRRAKSAAGSTEKSPDFIPHDKPRSLNAFNTPATLAPSVLAGAGCAGGAGGTGGAGGMQHAGSSASLVSVSAGASTILASSSSLDLRGDTLPNHARNATVARQSTRFPKSRIAPAPPTLGGDAGDSGSPHRAVAPVGGVSLMSDHLGPSGVTRSGVAWPSATIPARVKKLSWDDKEHKGSGDNSEVTEATNSSLAEHMNLTVYF